MRSDVFRVSLAAPRSSTILADDGDADAMVGWRLTADGDIVPYRPIGDARLVACC